MFKFLLNHKSRIKLILLGLIAATFAFKIKFGNAALILAIAYNIIFFEKKNFKKIKSWAFLFPLGMFLIIVVSSVLSKNNYGLRRLDLEALGLFAAVIIVNQDLITLNLKKISSYLFYSCIVSTLILIAYALWNFSQGAEIDKLIFHGFTALYDTHPVLYSSFLSMALFFSFNFEFLKRKTLQWVANGLLVIGIVLCASKAVILFDIIAFSVFGLLTLKNVKHKLVYGASLLLLAFLLFQIPFINQRFTEGLRFNESIAHFEPTNDFSTKKNFTYDEKSNISDLELRLVLWKIGMYHQLEDKKILFGYGKGDSKDHLNYYLLSYNLAPNWYENFNLHNQYLDILFTLGIFALLFFLIYLCYSFVAAIKNKNKFHLFFLLLISFIFIFDAPLTVNKGIVFFYFFNTLFLFNYLTFENSNIRNTRNT